MTRCFRNVSLMLWAQFRCIIFKTHPSFCLLRKASAVSASANHSQYHSGLCHYIQRIFACCAHPSPHLCTPPASCFSALMWSGLLNQPTGFHPRGIMPDWRGERQGKSLPHDTAKMWQWTKQTQSHIIGLVKMRCWTLNAAHCGTSVQNKEGIIHNIQYTGLFSKVSGK